jgi:hypothetical protein
VSSCPKCGGVLKDWDLVCPSCGATRFTPETPADERKVSVDLPDWEMGPVKPEAPRKAPAARPLDPRRAHPEARRIEVPSLPRPPIAAEEEEEIEEIDIASVEEPDAPGTLTRRSKQDTMPIARIHEEVTQPRARVPGAPPGRESLRPDPVEQADARETLTIESYDPERLKRILAQAQAQASTRARRQGSTLPIVIAVIVAVTIIGVALVIALLA